MSSLSLLSSDSRSLSLISSARAGEKAVLKPVSVEVSVSAPPEKEVLTEAAEKL